MRKGHVVGCCVLLFVLSAGAGRDSRLRLASQEAGLTDRQAAAYLLDRFTFGAGPGDIDELLKVGPDAWLEEQLTATLNDDKLNEHLAPLKSLTLSSVELASIYPNNGAVRLMAYQEGVLHRQDSLSRDEIREKLLTFAKENGFHPVQELIGQLLAQKVLRAAYSRNQMREVLTDFWFNHFNVSLTDNRARPYVLSYERDAIRPHVFGSFRDLLGATAKHPAMLAYLDNAQSTAPENTTTTMMTEADRLRNQPGLWGRVARRRVEKGLENYRVDRKTMEDKLPANLRPRKGINENYARELMELHTLGVDGGYTQKDVVDVARAFTGWTIYPAGPRGKNLRDKVERGRKVGFVVQGDFLFRSDMHDATGKEILGERFSTGGGVEEGERVLDILADHPSTAKFIAKKLATRFVSDDPPQTLIDRLARVYQETRGSISEMVRALAQSKEFWAEATRKSKIKSPFELAISSLRAMSANVVRPRGIIDWVKRMGEPLYAYQAPTGYPDRAKAWINTGSLLNRMNFGLNLASGKVQGVKFDLAALNQNREPASVEEALRTYAQLLLPERDLSETLRQLTPVVRDPDFARRLEDATPRNSESDIANDMAVSDSTGEFGLGNRRQDEKNSADEGFPMTDSPTLSHVVGIILGSPEFQKK